MPAIRIGSFNVTKGVVTYEDHSRPSEFAARLDPINFALVNFTTGVEGGRFTFTGSSKLGERVEWHGHLSVQPIESDGEFRIDGLRAHTIWEYLEDRLNFAVNSGTIDVEATYNFSLKDAFELQAAVAKAAINDLAVRPRQSDIDWITVPSLLLRGTSVDVSKRQAHLDALSLTGVKLVTWLEPDGSVNLLKLAQFLPAPAVSAAPAASGASASTAAPVSVAGAPAAGAAPASTAAPWTFDLREFSLNEASISAEDRSTSPAAKVLLAPLSLQGGGRELGSLQAGGRESRNAHRRYGFLERVGRCHAAAEVRQLGAQAERHRTEGGSALHREVHLDDPAERAPERRRQGALRRKEAGIASGRQYQRRRRAHGRQCAAR